MEPATTSKRFISQNFDKFKNRTDTNWVDPQSGKVFGAKWDTWFWELSSGYGEDRSTSSLGLGLRHVKTPDIDSIVIDYRYYSKDWIFLRNGTMIINLDGVDNITLEPHESDTDVRDGGNIQEVGFWSISKDDLKKVCDAKTISVRISGGSSYFELKDKGLLKFQFMCRSFYADLFDDNSYNDWINSIIPPGSEKKGGGCFIATAAMGSYDHPAVMDLRFFRDNWLLKRQWGINFTNWYYTHGPKAASVIEKSKLLQTVTFLFVVKPLRFLTKFLK